MTCQCGIEPAEHTPKGPACAYQTVRDSLIWKVLQMSESDVVMAHEVLRRANLL